MHILDILLFGFKRYAVSDSAGHGCSYDRHDHDHRIHDIIIISIDSIHFKTKISRYEHGIEGISRISCKTSYSQSHNLLLYIRPDVIIQFSLFLINTEMLIKLPLTQQGIGHCKNRYGQYIKIIVLRKYNSYDLKTIHQNLNYDMHIGINIFPLKC